MKNMNERKKIMDLIYKETGWKKHQLDPQDPDILTDIVISYYQKGFQDGQKALLKVVRADI